MGIERRTYGQSIKQSLVDKIKGVALIGLGVTMLYMGKEINRSFNEEYVTYFQPYHQTPEMDYRTATLDEFKNDLEKTAGKTIPYIVGAFGVITIIGGASRVTNRKYRF